MAQKDLLGSPERRRPGIVRNHQVSSGVRGETKTFFLLYTGLYRNSDVKMKNAYVIEDVDSKEELRTHVIHLKMNKEGDW